MARLTNIDGKWTKPVGQLMISFAHVEREVLNCLLFCAKDHIIKHVSKLSFRQRLDLLVEILSQYRKKSDAIEELLVDLKRIEKLSEIRNRVAHNPLILDISQDPKDDATLNEYIANAINGGHQISFEYLLEIVEQLAEMEKSLSQQVLNIKTSLILSL